MKSIEVTGNDRISKDTILMFSEVKKGSSLNTNELNEILKKIYQSNFFSFVSVDLSNNTLQISVEELQL